MKLTTLLEADDPANVLRRATLELQTQLLDLPNMDLDVTLTKLPASHRSDDTGHSIRISYSDKHKLIRGEFTVGYMHNEPNRPVFFATCPDTPFLQGNGASATETIHVNKIMARLTNKTSMLMFKALLEDIRVEFGEASAAVISLLDDDKVWECSIFAPFIFGDSSVTANDQFNQLRVAITTEGLVKLTAIEEIGTERGIRHDKSVFTDTSLRKAVRQLEQWHSS